MLLIRSRTLEVLVSFHLFLRRLVLRILHSEMYFSILSDCFVFLLLSALCLWYTARDHLANERTWLAYLRTSLAIASTGVGAFTYHSSNIIYSSFTQHPHLSYAIHSHQIISLATLVWVPLNDV